MEGWIKMHRKMMNWEWYHDSETVHLLLHCIIRANHKPGKWQGQEILRGQFITGRDKLSLETGISEKKIRLRLKRLEESGEIVVKGASKFSIITICKYDEYQEAEIQKGQQRANKGPTKGQQRATNKNDKNEKNEKNITEQTESPWDENNF